MLRWQTRQLTPGIREIERGLGIFRLRGGERFENRETLLICWTRMALRLRK